MKLNQIISSIAIVFLLLAANTNLIAQTVTQATGGTGISADNVGGAYTSLTGPVITETVAVQISTGFIDLTVPAGFEWNTGITPTVTVDNAPGENGKTKLAANFVSINSTVIRAQVTSTSAGGGARRGRITFGNIQIRPTSGVMPNAGNITNTGTSGPSGATNYGSLSIVAGAPTQVRVETANNGSGTVVTAQNLTAGTPLTVYSISRDQFGNFVSNVAADTWSIINPTGNVESTDLSSTSNTTSTTLTSNLVGSGNIRASEAGLTAVNSGTITIVPDAPSQLSVETASNGSGTVVPAQNLTAGTSLTVYSITRDQYGNFVSNVAADTWSIVNPTGSVESTDLTPQSNSSSTTLSSNLVGSGNIQAGESGFTSANSGTITVVPASASALSFSVQPSNSLVDSTITPSPEVQIVDTYGNAISQPGTTVSMTIESGPGSFTLGSITAAVTNASGVAVFNNLALQASGNYTLRASDITATLSSVVSNSFSNLIPGGLVINEWTSSVDTDPNPSEWNRAANWTLGVPTPSQLVLIPTTPSGDVKFPVLDTSPTVAFLEIESGASVTANSSFTITVTDSLSGDGALILNNTTGTFGGDISISTLNASNSTIILDGTETQTIDGNINSDDFTISNTAAPIQINGNLTANSISASGSYLGISGDIDVSTVTSAPATVEFNGTTNQSINDFNQFVNLTVNKSSGELLGDTDINVSGTLTLTQGDFVLGSGRNLIAPTRTITSGQIRFLRELTSQGWYLLSSPVNTDFDNFLDGTLTQGYAGSTLGNAPLDSLQPTVMYYDETYPGTDLQRWRAPSNASDNVSEGVGYFVYAFGNIPADSRYNDDLPDTLDVGGAEFNGSGSTIDFGITYTASADTGWNLVGNPFGATLDWDDAGNWTKTNVDNTIYVWDRTANSGNGDYLVWNGVTGSLGNGLIAPFQGFWVKANAESPSLVADLDVKTNGGTFYKSSQRSNQNNLIELREAPRIGFKLSTEGLEKESFIMFSEEGLIGKDAFDAYQLEPFTNSYLELYTKHKDGSPLTINHLPRKFGRTVEIPIYIDAFKNGVGHNGTFSLSLSTFENIPYTWELVLEDLSTGEETIVEREKAVSFDFSSPNSRSKQKSGFDIKSKRADSDPQFILKINPGDDASGLPNKFELKQNYPNPFNPSTTFVFDIPVQSPVTLEIYDIIGRKVSSVIQNKTYQAGTYEIPWSASSLASGVYIYRLATTEGVLVKKMTLIK